MTRLTTFPAIPNTAAEERVLQFEVWLEAGGAYGPSGAATAWAEDGRSLNQVVWAAIAALLT